jgi:hypothetical protein
MAVTMQTLDAFAADALQHKRDGFERIYPHPFLLLKVAAQVQTSEDWSFQTRIISATAPRAGQRSVLKESAAIYRVLPLVKDAGNPWPERISLGRARNNDVVLADSSVSKLHGHYTWDKQGGMFLTDTNSRNGIIVQGEKLAPNVRAQVHFGDTVVFGSIHTTFVSAVQLFTLIETLLLKE